MDVNRVAELSVDFNELAILRKEGKVLLNPIGTLPRYSQQNADLGLPIAIMDYQYDLVEDYRRTKIIGSEEDTRRDSESPCWRQSPRILISPSKCVYPENFPECDNVYKVVYRDLVVNYGYYVQQGSKYGCDFVLYESDPDTCHSSYLLNIADTHSGSDFLTVQDLILWQRVSNKVNKKAVIAVVPVTGGRDRGDGSLEMEIGYFTLDNYDSGSKVIR